MADIESVELGQQPVQIGKCNVRMLVLIQKREADISELSDQAMAVGFQCRLGHLIDNCKPGANEISNQECIMERWIDNVGTLSDFMQRQDRGGLTQGY